MTVESPDEPLRDESDPADTDEFDSTTDVEDAEARGDGDPIDGNDTNICRDATLGEW
ncbi:MAG: hypothetical protein MZW92_02830 [Comamonadaceae bacterium]|nr:hypothetical protein [Comamonadaceae bacterium]